MFTENPPKSKDFTLNRSGWYLMILAKFKKKKKILPNQKFGSVRPKDLCVCCLLVFFPSSFFFHSSPDLNLRLYSPYFTISVSKIQNFQLLIGHTPLRHTLFVCKRAIGADAPPNHPPMSKTDVQPCVVLVY